MHKMKKGLLKGKKVTCSHTTVIDDARPLVEAAKRLDEVRKVVIGIIVPARSAQRWVKFVPIPAGLRLNVRGVTSVQKIFIYTRDASKVQETLEQKWAEFAS